MSLIKNVELNPLEVEFPNSPHICGEFDNGAVKGTFLEWINEDGCERVDSHIKINGIETAQGAVYLPHAERLALYDEIDTYLSRI